MRPYVSQSQFRSALYAHGERTADSNALSLAETVGKHVKMTYRELFSIEDELPSALGKVSEMFSVEISDEVLRKIHSDSVEDQVNEKRYDIATVSRKLRKDLIIIGLVDEYEPETICLELTGLTKSEMDELTEKIERK